MMDETITTLRGVQALADLTVDSKVVEDTPDHTVTATEYAFEGELVRRDVHLHLKHGLLARGAAMGE
jgi:hypothetical protein